ncbi:ThiF family adenylyltransferase [Zeaxanthinibacter enoshimensis]|uniref:ThiF family adenylyltransferase n=1 Tax=Zeaxanthinibacter enoshimensis TaxID=392009 RepID=UPI00356B4D27
MNTNRYIRQTSLEQFGPEAQQKLSKARVLIVGMGGLGIPAAQYLNAMGVGTLGLVESDTIELHNLQRQVLYTEEDCGSSKLEAAVRFLGKQNSGTELRAYHTFLDRNNALQILRDYEVIIDATDNFSTRYLINDACVILNKPLVYGALHALEGQLSVFNFEDGPTYRCLFPSMPGSGEIANCDQNGVLGVIPGIIGNMQALETVKIITGIGEVLSGKLLLYDGLSQRMQQISFPVREENRQITCLAKDYGNNCETGMRTLRIEEYMKMAGNPEGIQLIDVRTEEEYRADHLPGAVNIPLNNLERSPEALQTDKIIYLLCASGIRSIKAWHILKQRVGPDQLIVIAGGMNDLRVAAKS